MPFKLFPAREPLSKGIPMNPARRRRLIFSYAPDWILTIILSALFFSLDKVDGYRRDFSIADTSLRHPYAVHERVPNVALYMICFVAPLCIMPVVNFITVRSWWDFHNSTLGLILGLALTGAVTQTVKITVGRPRPDIISRCQPLPGLSDPPYQLTNWTVCTQEDNAILTDGFRSFPSGHSSLSFAGLGFLAFYLAGKLHLFDERGHAGKAWISLFPFLGAALVAVSRSMDYRHHWHDILVGSLLGTTLGFFAYRQYYPSLASPLSHRPYSPRIKDEGKIGPVLPVHHHHQDQHHQGEQLGLSTFGAGAGAYQDPYNFTSNNGRRPSQDDDDDEGPDGTVLRPGPAHLHEVWKEGEEEEEEGVYGGIQNGGGGKPVLPRLKSNSGSGRGNGMDNGDAVMRSS